MCVNAFVYMLVWKGFCENAFVETLWWRRTVSFIPVQRVDEAGEEPDGPMPHSTAALTHTRPPPRPRRKATLSSTHKSQPGPATTSALLSCRQVSLQ